MGLDEEFEERFFPGSKRRIPAVTNPPKAVVEDAWDIAPIKMRVQGVETEFFSIGMLARGLSRTSRTLREWEALGIIPKARYRAQSKDPQRQRRLYTRAQCEGIIRIAWEEGLMASAKAGGLRRAQIPNQFTVRVLELFQLLEGKP